MDEFAHLTNLAQPRLGARVIAANDDFFANKSRLIAPENPVFIPDKYDDHGKWMDGWESRRRRTHGHDWAVIRLGQSAQIAGFEVDTAHFTGNYPPYCSIDMARCDNEFPSEIDWVEIVAKSALCGDKKHLFSISCDDIFTHIRLNIYPDGGVARLRVYGQVNIDWETFERSRMFDLAALEYGGQALFANDQHFGCPENLIAPGKGVNMGDGWETRRSPARGSDETYWTLAHDFAVLKLAHKGVPEKLMLDTGHFKGNYPDRASVQAADCTGMTDAEVIAQSQSWPVMLEPQKLEPDQEHEYTDTLQGGQPITHIRLNIYPDGGVSRLRLFGHITG